MNGTNYSFEKLTAATEYWTCGLHQFELKAMTSDNQFFKINITADGGLVPGNYLMGDQPTNLVAGTCTFWYSGKGTSYTAKQFVITVTSFDNGALNARFGGGSITKGSINGTVFNK